MALNGEGLAHDRRGARQRLVDIAEIIAPARGDVPRRVDLGRVGLQRRRETRHHRQPLPVDGDILGGVLGRRAARRHHDRDRLADIAHDIAGEHVLQERRHVAVGRNAARDRRQLGRQVGRGHDREDIGPRQGTAGIDAHDAGMRMRTAHDQSLGHERQRQVGDVAALAAEEPFVFDPRDAGTDHRHSGELRIEDLSVLDDGYVRRARGARAAARCRDATARR